MTSNSQTSTKANNDFAAWLALRRQTRHTLDSPPSYDYQHAKPFLKGDYMQTSSRTVHIATAYTMKFSNADTRSGEPLLIPEKFQVAARRATAGSCCIGCSKHCHLLQPGAISQSPAETVMRLRPSADGQAGAGGDGEAHLPSIEEVLSDPSTSFWLRDALRAALARDPVDAAHDSEIMARLLDRRCQEILAAR